jgi:hypothetical protein
MDTQTVNLPLDINVLYWARSRKQSDIKDASKVKVCDVHPVHSWFACHNREDIFQIWDYGTKSCIASASLSEIIGGLTKGGKAFASNPMSKQAHVHNDHKQTSFVGRRTFRKTQLSTSIFKYNDQREVLKSNDSNEIKVKDFGEVKRIAFIDRTAIQYQCGGLYISPTSNSYNNGSRIMIICDTAIIFYDFVTKVSHAITSIDLSKSQPCSAEFVFVDLCAIGCADGMIR